MYSVLFLLFSNQMIASPSGPQLTPGGQMSGPIRSIGKFSIVILFIVIKIIEIILHKIMGYLKIYF